MAMAMDLEMVPLLQALSMLLRQAQVQAMEAPTAVLAMGQVEMVRQSQSPRASLRRPVPTLLAAQDRVTVRVILMVPGTVAAMEQGL
jgi:hypothetical protein